MPFDAVVDKAVFEQGLTEIAELIRTEMGEPETLPFPGMASYLERVFTLKNTLLQDAKDITKTIIERTITIITDVNVVRVAPFSFYKHPNLRRASFPNAASAGESAFEECAALTSVNLPAAEIIGVKAFKSCPALVGVALPKVYEIRKNAFDGCTALTSIDLPSLKTLNQYAFAACSALTTLDLPGTVTEIPNHAFRKATNLSALYLRSDSVVTLEDAGAFYGIAAINVYVPGELVESYETAENWSALRSDGVVTFLPIPEEET